MTKSLRQINNERKEIKDKNLNVPDEFKNIYKVVDKLEQRISTLEKVIGKLQLRLGDVVLYIDKKAENNDR